MFFKLFKILLLVFIFKFNFNDVAAIKNEIILKVGNEIITSLDIKKEAIYLMTLNSEIEKLSQKQIYEISKNSLIREKIKKKEIVKNFKKIEVNQEVLDQIFKNMYSEINLNSKSEFKNFLEIKKINFDTVEEKIKIEILWNRLIYLKYNKKINININEIKNKLNNDQKNLKQIFLQEIMFELKNKEKLENKFLEISKNIEKNGFEKTALTESIADSSKKKGNIGWVNANTLNKNILNELKSLKIGDYSKPITIPGGFLILKIKDIKIIKKEINIKSQLDKIVREKTNQQLNQYSNIYYNKIKKNINIDEI